MFVVLVYNETYKATQQVLGPVFSEEEALEIAKNLDKIAEMTAPHLSYHVFPVVFR